MMSAKAASEPSSAKGATTGRAFGVFRRRPAVAALAGFVLVMLLLHAFVAETFTVPSASMEPSYRPGDRIVVNKLSGPPERGQVIVFDGDGSLEQNDPPGGLRGTVDTAMGFLGFRLDETDYLKRVVGVAGDRVSVDHSGVLKVNGTRVSESYLPRGTKASDYPFSLTVPPGSLFVMGDNRAHSNDSRNHLGDPGGGFVPVDKVIGQVSWRYWRG